MNAKNEISIYQQMSDPVTAMTILGSAIAKSQIFGCKNESQGQVLAMECMAKGLSPLSLAEKYDIIQGKLSMKSDAMLAGFEDAGGKYEVKEYSSEACEIVFNRNGSSLPIRITWDDAQKETWPFKGDGKTLKHNWATPIGRQDMLWARVVSRGVRRLAAGVVCGRYTPEEISDFSDQTVVTQNTPAVQTIEEGIRDGIVDAEFQKAETASTPLTTVPENEEKQGMLMSDPVLDTTVDRIKTLIGEASQLGMIDLASDIKAKLKQSGLNVLADLTQQEAEVLVGAIEKKNLAAWLGNPINGHQSGNETGE